MNITERYVCSYIVESLLGISGERPEYVHDVLEGTDAKMSHPVLQEVLDFIQGQPFELGSEFAQKAVVSLVFPRLIAHNKDFLDLIDYAVQEERNMDALHSLVKEAEELDRPKYNAYLYRYGDIYKMFVYDVTGGHKMKLVGVAISTKIRRLNEEVEKHFPGTKIIVTNIELPAG